MDNCLTSSNASRLRAITRLDPYLARVLESVPGDGGRGVRVQHTQQLDSLARQPILLTRDGDMGGTI